jgi:hypothetical protein
MPMGAVEAPIEPAVEIGAVDPTGETAEAEVRAEASDRDRDRDRGERRDRGRRGGRDRDRGERRERRDTAPDLVQTAEEPAAAPARAEKRRNGAPAGDMKEFWETWADEKSTRADTSPPAREARESSRRRDRADTQDERRSRREREPREERAEAREERKAAPPVDPAGQVRLYVSLGKSHDASAGDVRALLARALDGDTARIGSVMLRDSHSYVKVPAELADAIIAAAHGSKHGDVEVTVERARGEARG